MQFASVLGKRLGLGWKGARSSEIKGVNHLGPSAVSEQFARRRALPSVRRRCTKGKIGEANIPDLSARTTKALASRHERRRG